ncbi:amidohydrolase [Mycolicibacterium agri]|uniref:Amidohydrolase n=1 Tax=Mycolicibacterium agri TaxID=36811 RepID=A0A2A7NE00_MYCAG|nr:amidohydrolase family protein [Mycolicibacterium agri]PEG41671.1 amidohydrolase [Mycolicibacterium agri]GFG50106.1 amidohydrolase [Mycolicibacterium agri]
MNRARIDVHHHVVPPQYRELFAAHGMKAGGRSIPDWSAEDAARFMDTIGVETAIMSVSTPGTEPVEPARRPILARQLNEFCADVVRSDPERFGFWATLTLPDVDSAIAEATYSLDELHADGVVVLANSEGTYLGDRRFDPLMAELDRRNAVIFVHPSTLPGDEVPGIGAYLADFLLDTSRTAISMVLNGTLDRYPNLRVILSHAGGFIPFAAERIATCVAMERPDISPESVLEGLRKFYFDTALSASRSALPALLAFAQPDHIVFGSDYPYAPAEIAARFTRNLDNYEGVEHAAVNRDNALKLLPRLSVGAAR